MECSSFLNAFLLMHTFVDASTNVGLFGRRTSPSNFSLVCSYPEYVNRIYFHLKRQTDKNYTAPVNIELDKKRCVMYVYLYKFSECTCKEYGVMLCPSRAYNDGDQWKCSFRMDGAHIFSNVIDMHEMDNDLFYSTGNITNTMVYIPEHTSVFLNCSPNQNDNEMHGNLALVIVSKQPNSKHERYLYSNCATDGCLFKTGLLQEDQGSSAFCIRGSQMLAQLSIYILHPPKVMDIPDMYVIETDVVNVICDVIPGYPPETEIMWLKGGTEISNSQLLIERAKKRDAGVYTCLAKNKAFTGKITYTGTDNTTFTLHVKSLISVDQSYVERFVDKTNVTTTENEETVVINCIAIMHHITGSPILKLMKDDVEIRTSVVINTMNISSIRHAKASASCNDNGKYTCVASSGDVTEIKDLFLNIQCPEIKETKQNESDIGHTREQMHIHGSEIKETKQNASDIGHTREQMHIHGNASSSAVWLPIMCSIASLFAAMILYIMKTKLLPRLRRQRASLRVKLRRNVDAIDDPSIHNMSSCYASVNSGDMYDNVSIHDIETYAVDVVNSDESLANTSIIASTVCRSSHYLTAISEHVRGRSHTI
ncbi:uncharacterized protein LOC127854194 isoform X2 [Dreissena polymorpha]|uniref:uncharacterized protein LOC127854194 isoform X2 n=1 Tax=Dreissena polymorpha TaxID=45954 RepID=UPI0022643AE8|nr:uncharacterized protein LOC127854194 isoform X2 [Dreissena polymorpha]